MDNRSKYEEEVAFLTVDELKDILLNRHLHNGWEITFARIEQEKRGIDLTTEEKKQIDSNKKWRIEEARKNTYSLKNANNWYSYEDSKIKEINIDLKPKNFNSRIRNELSFNLIVFSLILLISLIRSNSDTAFLTLIFLGALFAIMIAVDLIVSIYRNKNYLIKLQANNHSISLKYYVWNEIVDLYSSWNDIEIEKSKSISRKYPKLILIFKNREGKQIKLYSEINISFTRKSLEELFGNLISMKGANSLHISNLQSLKPTT
jgi:hypothetical protein